MVKVLTFKMPFQTKIFNKNQRVWVKWTTGAMSAQVTGRFRGKNRYVEAHVSWSTNVKQNPEYQKFEVNEDFAKRHGILII